MKQYKKISSEVIVFLTSFSLFFASFINSARADTAGVITNPLNGVTDIPTFVSTIMSKYIVPAGGIIAIFAFIYSGYKFVAARGNEKELGEAKTIFYNTCIGVAILLGAELIASIIVGTIKNLQS